MNRILTDKEKLRFAGMLIHAAISVVLVAGTGVLYLMGLI